jgi:hypothetical protein
MQSPNDVTATASAVRKTGRDHPMPVDGAAPVTRIASTVKKTFSTVAKRKISHRSRSPAESSAGAKTANAVT